MFIVCSDHVKDALKFIFLPHVKLISEDEFSHARCHLCSKEAKYKLYNYICQRNKANQAI